MTPRVIALAAAATQKYQDPLTEDRLFGWHASVFNDRQRQVVNRLLDRFEGKLTSSKWAKLGKRSQDTANRDINDLVNRGILAMDAPETAARAIRSPNPGTEADCIPKASKEHDDVSVLELSGAEQRILRTVPRRALAVCHRAFSSFNQISASMMQELDFKNAEFSASSGLLPGFGNRLLLLQVVDVFLQRRNDLGLPGSRLVKRFQPTASPQAERRG